MRARTSSGYRALLSTPGAAAFSGAGMVGRLPIAMLGIGIVLLVQDRRGSYALAGLVSAAYAVGSALLGPVGSRLVDRHGQGRVLPPAMAISAAAVLALVLLAGTGAPALVLVACAAAAGATLPQLGSCVRARWNVLLTRRERADQLPQAYAWESVVDEVVFVLGPLAVVAGAVGDPAVGLVLAVLLGGAGTAAFVVQRATEPPVSPPAAQRPRAAMASPGLRTLVLSQVFVGLVFGVLEVAMVAFAAERGGGARGGVLLALVALGSGLSGLAYGARRWRRPLAQRYLLGLLGLAAGVVPLLLAPTVLTMAGAALLAGIAISPTLIVAFGLVDGLVPAAARTEGFTWLNSGLLLGIAAGSALAGAVAEQAGASSAFLVGLGGALAALLTAALGRHRVAPPQAGTAPGVAQGTAR